MSALTVVDGFCDVELIESLAGSALAELFELVASIPFASAGALAPAALPFALFASSANAGLEKSASIIISEKIRIKTSVCFGESLRKD